jgi:hypothetical protein
VFKWRTDSQTLSANPQNKWQTQKTPTPKLKCYDIAPFFERRSFTVYAEAFGEGVAKVIGGWGQKINQSKIQKSQ